MTDRTPLPIDPVLPDIVRAFQRNVSVVIEAPPGAGKTTRVPPALLAAGLAGEGGRIIMLEPRRVAARAAAQRIAEEFGEPLGQTVGYRIRFDRVESRATRILVVTEGLLLRMLQEDPFLEEAAIVLLDEFHERSLHADLALALCRRVQLDARPDLRLGVMSATLDAEPVARFLGDCPRVRSEGRTHPVEIEWLPRPDDLRLEGHIARTLKQVLASSEGDVLVFLPGVGEILRCQAAMEALAGQTSVDVVPLYGDLSAPEQDRAIRPGPRRRVVLATNVAETSVTIEGVRTVVDSGLHRRSEYDAAVGFDRLVLRRISRASAAQRAGRAGRTGPGHCIRLWSKGEEAGMDAFDPPEILRTDLAGPALQLLCWGETRLHTFPFLTPPSPEVLDDAMVRLSELGALDDSGVNSVGRAMAELPTGPRLARLLVEGHRLGVPRLAADAAALLGERDLFRRGDDLPSWRSTSDVLDRIEALRQQGERHAGRAVQVGARQNVRRVSEQLRRALRTVERGLPRAAPAEDEPPEDRLRRALLAAWPDRVTLARSGSDRRGVMVGRRGVQLSDRSALDGSERLWLSIELGAGQRGARRDTLVHVASAIEVNWLPESRLSRDVDVVFDQNRDQVMALERSKWQDLVLDERPTTLDDPLKTAEVLAEAAAEDPVRALAMDRPEVEALRARVEQVRTWLAECDLPALDDEVLPAMVAPLCWNRRSFSELRALSANDLEAAWLTPSQRSLINREAPTHIEVPSGRRVRLEWTRGAPPVLAARIQELFGWQETPRVIGGRVAVVLHLLAPNGRPQQVTEDLRSFWENTYPEVRRELRARYARHFWPEDPWNAPATSRTKKKM